MTDHNVRETLAVTDRAYIISNGRIFRAGSPDALGNDPEVRRVYLGENFYFPPVLVELINCSGKFSRNYGDFSPL